MLARSLEQYNPSIKFAVVFSEPVGTPYGHDSGFDEVVYCEELPIQDFRAWAFQHDVVEFCTGVKGHMLVHLLAKKDCESVVYIDPDCVVLSSVDNILSEFQKSSILLTPHITQPQALDGNLAEELGSLRHGVFNFGFLGVKNDVEGNRFARWWSHRLEKYCYDDPSNGIFTDQRWGDLVPALFDRVAILKNPGYNVATWNILERKVSGSLSEGFTANSEPLVFYHFSGLDSGQQLNMLNKYAKDVRCLYDLRDWYIAECRRLEKSEDLANAWIYGLFANGQQIEKEHRLLYRQNQELRERFPDPFDCAEGTDTFYSWCRLQEIERTEALRHEELKHQKLIEVRELVQAREKLVEAEERFAEAKKAGDEWEARFGRSQNVANDLSSELDRIRQSKKWILLCHLATLKMRVTSLFPQKSIT
ncbi:MAG: glycosyl transferase [Cyanobacteria bacterium DS2.3.42]|nr:glycosyl transferase [Cyanobacteria bacterium DS2.3.42]